MKYPKISSYPKEIRIKDETYQIRFVPQMRYRDRRGRYKPLYGSCDPEKRSISISKGQGREETFKTFIHEVLHAIEAENDFNIPHHLVARLEEPLALFFLDNF